MKKTFATVLITFGVLIILAGIGLGIFFGATPTGKQIIVNWQNSLKKVDESTYETQKEVEDTCRSMMASYNADKLIYEQYKDSDVEEERSWANSAKIRANQTASTYNNYILKNKFVWSDNIPSDIKLQLDYIK